jgi:hypothetical protein
MDEPEDNDDGLRQQETVSGIAIEFEDAENIREYVDRLAQDFMDVGIRAATCHLGMSTSLGTHTWHDYNLMDSGRRLEDLETDAKDIDITVDADELTGPQLDASEVREGIAPFVRFVVRTPSMHSLVFLYYPDLEVVVAPNIFHDFNDGGVEVIRSVLTAIKALSLPAMSGVTHAEVDLPDEKVFIAKGKIYKYALSAVGNVDDYFNAQTKRIRDNAHQFEANLISGYRSALQELKDEKDRLFRNTFPMPLLSVDLVARGIGMVRYDSDGSIWFTRHVKFVVNKVFKIGDGMAVNLPENIRIPVEGRMMVRCKLIEEGKFTPTGVRIVNEDDDYARAGALRGVIHPHIETSGMVCTGNYAFPPYITIINARDPNYITTVFDSIVRNLQSINPQSWYRSRADESPATRDWILANINTSMNQPQPAPAPQPVMPAAGV